MANTYLTALQGMEQLLPEAEKPMESFKKKSYQIYFQRYYESKLPVYEAVEEGYAGALDKEQFLFNMAEALKNAGAARIAGIQKKHKIDGAMMDMNLCMVVYVLPAILKYGGESSKPLTEEILRQWKEQFPKTNLSAASFEDIEAGFHKKWCYITTAVCETFAKPDNCYELTLLRSYRDSYLMNQPDGEEIIREYYDVAPTIVKRINRLPQRKEIYRGVWEQYLNPCITMIENDENEACKELYIKMVRDLQEQYFYAN